MARLLSRRSSHVLLAILSLFLLGTVAFLWAVRSYFSIDAAAIVRPEELGTWEEIQLGAPELSLSWKARYPWLAKALSLKPHESTKLDAAAQVEFDDAIAKHAADAAKAAGFGDDGFGYIPTGRNNTPKAWNPITDPPEKIPRIIHQTWKEKTLPPQWQAVRDECAHMHPDYKYMLWTDADSRKFLVDNYPWFLPIFDAYPYPIQRADAIRYFILHKYGGIYMDLDVGCLRRLDPLLRFEVVLPKTIPVGVSNDVMASAPGHPFMDHLIHNLVTFNHRYLTHYPTVMFSTGPMFVSASYGLYVDANGGAVPSTPSNPSAGFSGIRVLPKALYGKNAKPSEAPDSFFRHFYGSSWHAGDAGFLIFLREHGRFMIFIGFCLVVYGVLRAFAPRLFMAWGDRQDSRRRSSRRRGRWISLPFIRDPRSGQYRSLPDDPYADGTRRTKRFAEEGIQTGMSPTLSEGHHEFIGMSTRSSRTRVAAPRPQRAGLPLFQLGDGENSNGEDEDDLGPGLNAERLGQTESTSGILSWMNMSGSGSRPQSSASVALSSDISSPSASGGDGAIGLGRSGSASKSKALKSSSNGVLYLPAFLVGSNSSMSGSTDSTPASARTFDDHNLHSPTDSSAFSTTGLVPPWKLTKPHSRSGSNVPGSSLGNWAASFLNRSTDKDEALLSSERVPGASTSEHATDQSSALQRMWGGVSMAARTPSPSMFLNSFNNRRNENRSAHDLESIGTAMDSIMSTKEAEGATDDESKTLSSVITDDVPPPYESRLSGQHSRQTSQPESEVSVDDVTPKLSAQRKVGR
jgi:mannosyltransferase OCH1-like enzyme